MLQWLFRFPEFAEFIEFLFHLGKTPLELGDIIYVLYTTILNTTFSLFPPA